MLALATALATTPVDGSALPVSHNFDRFRTGNFAQALSGWVQMHCFVLRLSAARRFCPAMVGD
jgi:hypothetical protein